MRSLRVSCSVALVLAAAGCGDEGLGGVGGDDLAQSAAPGDLAGGSVDLASGCGTTGMPCAADMECVAGVGTCTVKSCQNGCCAGNTCVAATSASQCGILGASCIDCRPIGNACILGNCQCNGAAPCGAHAIC